LALLDKKTPWFIFRERNQGVFLYEERLENGISSNLIF
jgi:hypothetical protein